MIRSRIGRIVRVTIPVVLLVVVTSVVTLSAQGNPTLNQILAKLDVITALATPPATLSTSPMLVVIDNSVFCIASNIGTESVVIQARLLNSQGTVQTIVLDTWGSGETGPGETRHFFFLGTTDFYRCEFIVTGNATAIRANITVTDPFGAPTISEAR